MRILSFDLYLEKIKPRNDIALKFHKLVLEKRQKYLFAIAFLPYREFFQMATTQQT